MHPVEIYYETISPWVDWSFRTFSKLPCKGSSNRTRDRRERRSEFPSWRILSSRRRRLISVWVGFHPEYFSQSLETYYDRAEAAESVAGNVRAIAGLPSSVCTNILSTARPRAYMCRQVMLLMGDPITETLLLTDGRAKITQVGESGTEVILRLVAPVK